MVNPETNMKKSYDDFKSEVNTAFVVSIISLVLFFTNFRIADIACAIFSLYKHKKMSKDIELYKNMPDYSSTLSNLKYTKVISIISIVCSAVAFIITALFFVFYIFFVFGFISLPFLLN